MAAACSQPSPDDDPLPPSRDAALIYSPSVTPLMLVLLAFLILLVLLVEVRVLTYAYRKVGVHPRYAFAVMLLSLLGSQVNIPLFAVSPSAGRPRSPTYRDRWAR